MDWPLTRKSVDCVIAREVGWGLDWLGPEVDVEADAEAEVDGIELELEVVTGVEAAAEAPALLVDDVPGPRFAVGAGAG